MNRKLYNVSQDKLIASNVDVADTFISRIKGLLGKHSLPENSALWIKDCPSVHTFFMKFSIDVIFLDKKMRVTNVVQNLKPWRCTRFFQYKNKSCIELTSSRKISDLVSQGDLLDVRT